MVAAWFVASTDEVQARTKFQASAQETQQRIQNGLDSYVEVVRAGAALLAASNEINFTEFRGFVTGLGLRERYAGLQGIGFSSQVRRSDLRSFLRAIRLDGPIPFRVWPATAQSEHRPVVFFEPRPDRGELLGFDMSTEPILQAAMDRARDTGQPTASEAVPNSEPFETMGGPDFVLFIPVYRAKSQIETVEQRRRALVGMVFGPLRLEHALPRIMGANTPSVAFEIHADTDGDPAPLVYQSATGIPESRFVTTGTLRVAARNWNIEMRSFEGPVGLVAPAAQRTFIFGVLLSVLLFLITFGQVRAWELVARQEADLRASERALRESEIVLQQTLAREREARTHIEAADRAKDDFLATLSHELRTPLNAVLGWLQMLRTGSMREGQTAHALEVIERNARLQARLIEDLLDVSRIVMGKVHLALQPLAIAPIASAVIDSLRPTADAKGVTLHAVSATDTHRILGDSSRVQQIVWNLLSNGVKFTPAGGHVFMELAEEGRHVLLRVRDTGIGIAPAFLPHVFERFRQADSSTTRSHSGIGLGLAIARDLVELHGGSIEAQSDGINQGATFTVRFRAIPQSLPAALKITEAADIPLLKGVHVLVVDDDAETRDLLSQALTRSGARVTAASSAPEAFEHLTTGGADVLVSDIGMPEEDGLSLIRRVRLLPGKPGRIPAVALTAYAHAADRARTIEAGYQLHFSKPVELASLQSGLAGLTCASANGSREGDRPAN